MIHCDCGGKLKCIDSIKRPEEYGIVVDRVRQCLKCGAYIISSEHIPKAEIETGYRHRKYYKENTDDKDRED